MKVKVRDIEIEIEGNPDVTISEDGKSISIHYPAQMQPCNPYTQPQPWYPPPVIYPTVLPNTYPINSPIITYTVGCAQRMQDLVQ